jgi:hypothetical protein
MGLLALLAWRSALSVWWLLLPAVVFVWLVRRHGQVLYARDAAGRGVAFYERGVARLEDPGRGRVSAAIGFATVNTSTRTISICSDTVRCSS